LRDRRRFQKRPNPGFVGRGIQLQQLRIISQQQLIELVDGSAKILAQALFTARDFAQTENVGMIRRDPPEAMLVSAERIRRHVSIAAVVLRSGRRIPVPETIQLLGIDREYGESSLQEGFHHRPPRNLDRHGNGGWLAVCEVIQASQEVSYGLAVVIDPALTKDPATGIQNAGAMELRSPVKSDIDAKLTFYRTSLLQAALSFPDSATAANVTPVQALKKARTPHRTFGYGPPRARRSSTLGSRDSPPGLVVAFSSGGPAVYCFSSLRSHFEGYRGYRLLGRRWRVPAFQFPETPSIWRDSVDRVAPYSVL